MVWIKQSASIATFYGGVGGNLHVKSIDSHLHGNFLLIVSALKWLHSLPPEVHDNPFDSSICKNRLESANLWTPPIRRKLSITPNMIKAIIDKYAGLSASLQDLRVACLCSTAFTGFFPYNKICNIKPAHLDILSEYLKISVPRKGNYVYIKRLDNNYCAVTLLERYIRIAEINASDSDLSLFRRPRYYKSTDSYKLCSFM